MEVHAHTHSSPAAGGAARRKWTHYFWEFLMLFLAVFCGFLAEYQLEHKFEKDREKQFIRSLLEDLVEDTLLLTQNINDFAERLKMDDTLMRLLRSPDIKDHGSDLYFLGRKASRGGRRLAIHDFTIQQMRSSGGFRLIRKQKVSKAIIEYYNQLVFIDFLETTALNEAHQYRLMAIDVFDPIIFSSLVLPDNSLIRPPGNPPLLTYEPKPLIRLAGMVAYFSNTKMSLAMAQGELNTDAKELIKLINKEYHLK